MSDRLREEAGHFRRGDVWWANVDERCPVVILSHDGETVRAMIVAAPARRPIDGTAVEVDVGTDEGLSTAAVLRVAIPRAGHINCNWLVTLRQKHLLERAGVLSSSKLRQLEDALRLGELEWSDRACIVPAQPNDLRRYIDLLEDVADWLETRDIKQWRPGSFRMSADFYAGSIERGEVQLAFVGDELVGGLRLLLREHIVWPEVIDEDAVYVFNLAVKRAWAARGLGAQMLEWASARAAALGRPFVRLDCVADNRFLADYYAAAGFQERGVVDAAYPGPIATLRLRRFEKRL